MKTDNPIVDKSKAFAIAAVKLYKRLCDERHEYVLSKQFVRAGTSIGANVHEAVRAQSHSDFIAKMSIALKETQETEYWLDLLHETDYVEDAAYQSLQPRVDELLRLLTSICKTANANRVAT